MLMILAAMAAIVTPTADAPAGLADFTSACNDLSFGAAAIDAKAKAAKLTPWTKAELARAGSISPPTTGEPVALKSDVVKGWWFDKTKSASLIYQEAKTAAGQPWRSCVLSAHVPDVSASLKGMLAVETKPNPEAVTDREGKFLTINFDKGPAKDAEPGRLMAQVEKPVPFPDMNFQVFKKDPQWAPHTPHPIAVTEAEIFAATAQPGTVAFKRESPVAK